MPEKTVPRQVIENAGNEEEDRKYRVRQFYMLLLQADKERMAVFDSGRQKIKGRQRDAGRS